MNSEEGNSITEESIVTIDSIRQVLLVDKGSDAQLVSWKLVHFTKFGDNYACTVIALEVKYSLNEKQDDAYYVVKLNPGKGQKESDNLHQDLFQHESDFYFVSLPELNEVMKTIAQPTLNFPQYFYSDMKLCSEQIYFEDLRKKGYILFDRKKGMDVLHTDLVLRELARLHAASLLLQAKSSEPIEVRHKHLQQDIFCKDGFQEMFLPAIINDMNYTIQMLKSIGGYERAITWIENLKPQVGNILSTEMKSDVCNVICHGDCWNNNVLFRYDSNGSPIQVMLIDLQLCRIASPAADLNYFMYSSLTSEVRRPNLDYFLNTYYKKFQEIMDAGGMAMPFTKEQLLTEFRSKNKLGAIFSMMLIPIVLMEPSEGMHWNPSDGDIVKLLGEITQKAVASVHTNPIIKSRFLSTFDEFMETGLID